jgi:hypothetical protein
MAVKNRHDFCPWERADVKQVITHIARKCKLSHVTGKKKT